MNAAFIASFITLAVAGTADAGYLVWKHYRHNAGPLVCPLDHDCSTVTESKWASIFLVRNEVMGLLFYVSMLAAGVAAFFLPNSLLFLVIKLATGLALLVSLFLLWVQLYKVKDYCFYCIISALINVLLFLNGFFL
ncbi:MAG TPA: vitamin K epoxide reductase family protein [Candidatus Nanoarchaeia archaeon]|nr:vitamin K epoxide reductase family protein [Candidatus Nanoarchaeia archaeon]